jgi:phage terminase large subunit-like protein
MFPVDQRRVYIRGLVWRNKTWYATCHTTPRHGLVCLVFDVISVKKKTAIRRSPPEAPKNIKFPLFVITLPKAAKSQEIFRLPSLCHIAIRVEVYGAQNGLTQCRNCQQFDYVWANYKQPPHCLWFGGGHLHKECPEKGNTSSTPTCCNCRLAEGQTPHPANYRGCRHAKEEMQKDKSQRAPRTTTGRVFSSNLTAPGASFAAALRDRTEEQQQPQTHQVTVTGPATMEPRVPVALPQQEQQTTGQSVRAPNVNSSSLNKMLKVVLMAVQKIMTRV